MSEEIPRRAAYAAYQATVRDVLLPPWDELTVAERDAWEAAAKAAIAAAPHGSERVAELVSEGNQLRAELAAVREGILNLAAGLELSAASSNPSKKSEIERGCASALRGLLRLDGESDWETRQRLEREHLTLTGYATEDT